MSFALVAAKPDEIKSFIARSDGSITVTTSAAESWAGFLAANGGSGSRLPELEATWLASNGAVGNNLRDLWGSYLNQNGYTGNLQDQLRVFLTSGQSQAYPTDNLVASYSFESGAITTDNTGRGNTLTNNNAATSTAGKVGNAATFASASSQYLSSLDTADLSMGDIDFTISFWVNLTTKPAALIYLVDKQQSPSAAEFAIFWDNAVDRFKFQLYNSSATSIGLVTATTFGAPATATNYFVVCYHDSVNNEIGISVNNGAFDTTATTGVPADTTARFGVGVYSWSQSSGFLNGQIDQLELRKEKMTASQISYLYNDGSGRAYEA